MVTAQGKPMLVELKNGVTFNGHLVECDTFMNVTLREVYQTSADGERFWKMKEMFIKGNITIFWNKQLRNRTRREQRTEREVELEVDGVDQEVLEEVEVDHLGEEGPPVEGVDRDVADSTKEVEEDHLEAERRDHKRDAGKER
ncbi:hypothetical protein I310_00945 [Cryptococcus deuterogattii CA1014]|nr:hypothetical protein I352_00179 [Cryptococcus deuterogattii MMRL2647]KIR74671.1 hypothetical protein I310_00945 [Cryptococcus deuterogattii CA1014]KIS01568.1 hypothetical protein L804_01446 [Cryptococcus deuterogattii 2001/935-1]